MTRDLVREKELVFETRDNLRIIVILGILRKTAKSLEFDDFFFVSLLQGYLFVDLD